MKAFLQALINFLNYLGGFLKDLCFWVFDKFCTLLEYAIDLVNIPNYLFSFDWLGLPSAAQYVLTHIGVPHATIMISTSILLRMALNILPSWITRL